MSPRTEALAPGTLLDGRYEVTRPVAGDGAAPDVYEGVDRVLERPVRVKVHRGTSPDERHRFQREVHELASGNGPARDRVFDAGVDGDLAYAVFEAPDGEATTRTIAVVPAPKGPHDDLTQPIAADHTAEIPVPAPLPLPDPEPSPPSRWSPRATRNILVLAGCLLVLGALVLLAQNGPSAVDTPVESRPVTSVDGAQDDGGASEVAPTTTPSTEPPTTTVTTQAPTDSTLLPPGFPFGPEGGPGKGKEKKGKD